MKRRYDAAGGIFGKLRFMREAAILVRQEGRGDAMLSPAGDVASQNVTAPLDFAEESESLRSDWYNPKHLDQNRAESFNL